MYRELKGGRVQLLELLSLTREADGLWLVMRHFDPALKPREAADAPLRWRVEAQGPDRALFREVPGGATLDYRRNGDRLAVQLRIPREGGDRVVDFLLVRAQPGGVSPKGGRDE